jgi:hypothetical protein
MSIFSQLISSVYGTVSYYIYGNNYGMVVKEIQDNSHPILQKLEIKHNAIPLWCDIKDIEKQKSRLKHVEPKKYKPAFSNEVLINQRTRLKSPIIIGDNHEIDMMKFINSLKHQKTALKSPIA